MSQQNHQNPFVIKIINTCDRSRAGLARCCRGHIKQGYIRRSLHAPKLTTEAGAALECGSGEAVRKAQMQPDLLSETVRIALQRKAA